MEGEWIWGVAMHESCIDLMEDHDFHAFSPKGSCWFWSLQLLVLWCLVGEHPESHQLSFNSKGKQPKVRNCKHQHCDAWFMCLRMYGWLMFNYLHEMMFHVSIKVFGVCFVCCLWFQSFWNRVKWERNDLIAWICSCFMFKNLIFGKFEHQIREASHDPILLILDPLESLFGGLVVVKILGQSNGGFIRNRRWK